MADIAEAELAGFLFQWGDEAFVQANGGATFSANDVMMVVVRLLGEVKRFALENEALDQAGFAKGLENAIHRGPVADFRPHFSVNLVRTEGRGGHLQNLQNCPAPGGRLESGLAQRVSCLGVGMTHADLK